MKHFVLLLLCELIVKSFVYFYQILGLFGNLTADDCKNNSNRVIGDFWQTYNVSSGAATTNKSMSSSCEDQGSQIGEPLNVRG